MTIDLLERHSTGFRHDALFYRSREELLGSLTEFVREGVEAGEPILVALPPDRIASLREHVPDSDVIEYRNMREVGRNPARLISLWHDFVMTRGTHGRPLRGVAEPVWPGRTPEELEECLIHEWLLAVAFDGSNPWTLLCPYDVAALDPAVVERARRAHPLIDTRRRPHLPMGIEPRKLLDGPLPPAPPDATVVRFDADRLRELRRIVATAAKRAWLDEKAEDFVFAVNEVATNSLAHGGGHGEARLWNTGEGVVCDVLDRGHVGDPLAGRRRPPVHHLGGHGLWLANQMCDLMQVRSRPDGTLVRLHMYAG